ncbi:MAG: hypothetical protein JWR08_523 [Enterovirga sp.]|nr:hypothetical protein [Enterovirga sp.]
MRLASTALSRLARLAGSSRKQSRLARDRALVASSLLFDPDFYRANARLREREDAAAHFCMAGWQRGLNPSLFFATAAYLTRYPDIRAAGLNPLAHYLIDGWRERRSPHPSFNVNAFCDAHPDIDWTANDPAEACIRTYGSYDWDAEAPLLPEPSPAVAAGCRALFDEAFYRSYYPEVMEGWTDPYLHYMAVGHIKDCDPSPGFDTAAYRAVAGLARSQANPLAHYVEQGHAQGLPALPDNRRLLLPTEPDGGSPGPGLRVGAHLHCFYPDLLGEAVAALSALPADAHLVVTVTGAADRDFAKKYIARSGMIRSFEVRVVPNRGRDIAPFLVACRDMFDAFDVVLHVHTKVSPHVEWGDAWRHYLFDQLLGSAGHVDAALRAFEQEPRLGVLYPANFCLIRRFATMDLVADELGEQLGGVAARSRDGTLDYPAGSMAWYRTAALRDLLAKVDALDVFERERQQVGATVAHLLERAIPASARDAGFAVSSYVTPVRTRIVPAPAPAREPSTAQPSWRWPRDTPRIARERPLPLAPLSRHYDPACLDIHWILPSFGRGAGGHTTIFRMVELLERFGHRQTVWLQNATNFPDQATARARIREWYKPIGDRVQVLFLPDDMRQLAGDVLIATDCWTVFPAIAAENFKERFYFVQDFEPDFHPAGENKLVAEATYGFGLSALTAGAWLLEKMQERGVWARAWDLCADLDCYHPGPPSAPADPGVLQIAFYARPYTPRRAVHLGFAAFAELRRRGLSFQVHLFGEDNIDVPDDFPHVLHGILSPDQLGDLYRSCDVGVVFSATNYSLIPLEMMACDLPVVELDVPSTRAIFKDGEVAFAKPLPFAVADAIEQVVGDDALRAEMRRKGRAFVARSSWEDSARRIEEALRERLAEMGFAAIDPRAVAGPALSRVRKASIFIPTYNAGPGFDDVLAAIRRQACDFDYDLLVMDSGSTDGTAERVLRLADPRVRLERIDKAQFQHGRTRNLGISRTDGEFVALLTQDAMPKDGRWLSNLVAGFGRGDRVAGVTGRHEAYPEHDPFTKRDMNELFDALDLLPSVVDLEVGLPSFLYSGSLTWRMRAFFYSDNNSAMSRAVWKVLPYPEIPWGEDQVWAAQALRLGFQKVYADDAVVYHSHAFDLAAQEAVSVTEGRFWAERFGIDVHPDPAAAIAGADARDAAYAAANGIPAARLDERKRLNRATIEGRKAGWRSVSDWAAGPSD